MASRQEVHQKILQDTIDQNPPHLVMGDFLSSLSLPTKTAHTSLAEALAAHLIQEFRWLPLQVLQLTDREIQFCLHNEWQRFLDNANPDRRQAILVSIETYTDQTWRETS